jgi:hypothetical protein
MPEIDITGSSPKGTNQVGDAKFSNDTYRNAHLENASINASLNAQRRLAERVKSEVDTRAKTIRQLDDRQYKDARTLAQFENSQLDMRIRKQKNADNQEYKDAFQLARLENSNLDMRIRKQKAEDAREYREARGLAHLENTNIDIRARRQKALDERKYRDDYALAMRMNRDYDIRAARIPTNPGIAFAKGFGANGGGIGNRLAGGWHELLQSIPVLGPAIEMAMGAAKDLVMAPQEVQSTLAGMYASAKPIMDLRLQGAQIGREGGFTNTAWANSLAPTSGGMGAVPAWMRQFGVDPLDVAGVLGAYGPGRIGSTLQGMGVAGDLYSMANSNYTSAFSASQLAGMAGNYQTLTGGNPSYGQGNGLLDGDQGRGSMAEYWRKFQGVLATGVAYGLDSSQVGNTLNTLVSNAGAQGSQINTGALSSFWSRMVSSGDPNMRTGQGVLTAQQAAAANVNSSGYGGNVLATQALSTEINLRGGLKSMTTRAGVAKMFGVDLAHASPSILATVDDVISEAKKGNITGAITASQPLANSNPDFDFKAGMDTVKTMPGYATMSQFSRDQAAAGYAGVSVQAYRDWRINTNNGTVLDGGGFVKPIDLGSNKSIIDAAAAKSGVSTALYESLVQHESGGNFRRPNAKSGDAGFGQVSLGTFNTLQSKGLLDSRWKFSDLSTNPQASAEAGAAALKMYTGQYGLAKGLEYYGGWVNSDGSLKTDPNPKDTPQQRAAWNANFARKAGNYVGGILGSADPQDIGNVQSIVAGIAQGNVDTSRGPEQALETALSGSNGDAIITFEQATTDFQASVGKFADSITAWIHNLNTPTSTKMSQYNGLVNHPRGNRPPSSP